MRLMQQSSAIMMPTGHSDDILAMLKANAPDDAIADMGRNMYRESPLNAAQHALVARLMAGLVQ